MRKFFRSQRRIAGPPGESSGSSDTAPPPTRKTFPAGIKLLHSNPSAVVDIVFIHGLTGDRERTWTAKDASEPWPQALLPLKLNNIRVLAFGYDAYISDWKNVVSENRIRDHA
ncbi:unnamed protein product [Parascedosporium putredinis]|uniref:Uncharacterized protein n=1 Tax=Parascedosporium putredinis TaxID=1442378 RepID=A0A9P1H3L2_9PEZI|nr:unnamed protein product [Parascedosporium putredinis]CAI7997329.1 unnamed protein product [Parascedosporium putredinis]